MYKFFILVTVLIQFGTSMFYTPVNQCDHDLCEPNGVCRLINSSYECECKEGFGGQHCELEECKYGGSCRMAVDYCNAYPKIVCLNGGHCINTARGFHCLCSANRGGEYCEGEKKPVMLDGQIVAVLSGKQEEVMKNLDQILIGIGQANNFAIQVETNPNSQKPLIYSLKEEERLDNKIKQVNGADELGEAIKKHQDVYQQGQVMVVVFQIEITRCLRQKLNNPELECPDNIELAVDRFHQNSGRIAKVLEPFGVNIVHVYPRNFQQEQRLVVKKQIMIVVGLASVIILLVFLIVFLLKRGNRSHWRQNLIEEGSHTVVEKEGKERQSSSLSSIVTTESSDSTENDQGRVSLISAKFQILDVYQSEIL